MPTPVLDIEHLRIERGNATLIQEISWQVQRGEHWVVLGPNGCGKTSLLRSLAGYLPPTHGTIQLLGRTYGETDWRDLRLKLGIVSSSLQISIPPAEPAGETVISGKFAQLDLWAKTTRADHAKARRLLAQLGVPYLLEREWMYLSQGERQRVLIARALMAKPEVLILDEPCAGLDPVARRDFLISLDALAARPKGPSLVLVTHHVEEITPSFTHALLLRQGKVTTRGPIPTVLTSEQVSEAFGASISLHHKKEGWGLQFED